MPSSIVGSGCEAKESLRYLESTKSDCIWVQDSLIDLCHDASHFGLPALVAFSVVADPSHLYQVRARCNEFVYDFGIFDVGSK